MVLEYLSMNIAVSLLLVAAQSWLVLGGLSNGMEPEPRVIGGHDAKPHSRPYMVSLQTRLLFIRAHICGGSLLNENWVLTAAHCIKASWLLQWLPMDVVAGASDVDRFDSKVQFNSISKRIAHPEYNGGIGPHDIAVLRTSTPFQFTKEIRPIQLPARDMNYKSLDNLLLSGWGALRTTTFFPDLPSKLQEVDVTYIPFNKCYDAIEELKDYDEKNPLDRNANICSGPITGGVAACNGDSGGPLVNFIKKQIEVTTVANQEATTNVGETAADEIEDNEIPNGEADGNAAFSASPEKNADEDIPVVVGIVSWGVSPCGEKGAPTVYTKVSPYLDFINKNIKF